MAGKVILRVDGGWWMAFFGSGNVCWKHMLLGFGGVLDLPALPTYVCYTGSRFSILGTKFRVTCEVNDMIHMTRLLRSAFLSPAATIE